MNRTNLSHSFTTSEIVTVVVGQEKKSYKLHRSLLVTKSSFFAKCLNSGMIEQEKNEIVLPEDSCRAFDFLADWIYYGSVQAIMPKPDIRPKINAWVMADKYCMPEFQNALLDNLAAYWKEWCLHPIHVIGLVDLAGQNSPLYKLMLAVLAHNFVKSPEAYARSSNNCGEDKDGDSTCVEDGNSTSGKAECSIHVWYEDPDSTDDILFDWAEALDEVLARPGLGSDLLRKVAMTEKAQPRPAKFPHKYHVAVRSDEQGNGTEDKKKAQK